MLVIVSIPKKLCSRECYECRIHSLCAEQCRSIFYTAEIVFEDLVVGHDHVMLHEQINTSIVKKKKNSARCSNIVLDIAVFSYL